MNGIPFRTHRSRYVNTEGNANSQRIRCFAQHKFVHYLQRRFLFILRIQHTYGMKEKISKSDHNGSWMNYILPTRKDHPHSAKQKFKTIEVKMSLETGAMWPVSIYDKFYVICFVLLITTI